MNKLMGRMDKSPVEKNSKSFIWTPSPPEGGAQRPAPGGGAVHCDFYPKRTGRGGGETATWQGRRLTHSSWARWPGQVTMSTSTVRNRVNRTCPGFGVMKMVLTSGVFLPQTHNSGLIMVNKADNFQLGGILQNS